MCTSAGEAIHQLEELVLYLSLPPTCPTLFLPLPFLPYTHARSWVRAQTLVLTLTFDTHIHIHSHSQSHSHSHSHTLTLTRTHARTHAHGHSHWNPGITEGFICTSGKREFHINRSSRELCSMLLSRTSCWRELCIKLTWGLEGATADQRQAKQNCLR